MPRIYIGRHWFNPEIAHKWTDWSRKERLYMAIGQSDPDLRWIREHVRRGGGDSLYDFISPAAAREWLAAAGQLEFVRSSTILQALGLCTLRSSRLQVAASVEERECWQAAADAVAESVSEWVRNQLNEAAHTEDRLLGIEERRLQERTGRNRPLYRVRGQGGGRQLSVQAMRGLRSGTGVLHRLQHGVAAAAFRAGAL